MIRGAAYLIFCLISGSLSAHEMIAFGIKGTPFFNVRSGVGFAPVTLCYVDKVNHTLRAMNNELRGSLADTQEILATQKPALIQAAKTIRCQYLAASLGVTQLPAIVLDGRYVVYGTHDIALAGHSFQSFFTQHGINHLGEKP